MALTTPSSAESEEIVQLYLYCLYDPSWSVLGRTLPFTFNSLQVQGPETDSSFQFLILDPFGKLLKTSHVFLSVRRHGTIRLTLDGLPLKLILEYFSKICRENSTYIKI